MINNQLKIKKVIYKDNKLYTFNNIDKEKLDENSEFPIASLTKILKIILLELKYII